MKKVVLSLFVLATTMLTNAQVTKVTFVESEREADVVVSFAVSEREANLKVALVDDSNPIVPNGYKEWKLVNYYEKPDLKVFITYEGYRRGVLKILCVDLTEPKYACAN